MSWKKKNLASIKKHWEEQGEKKVGKIFLKFSFLNDKKSSIFKQTHLKPR